MKKLILFFFAACISSIVSGQEIPEIIVSTDVFQKEFKSIRNQTYNDNTIGKKIELESAFTKNNNLLLKKGNFYTYQVRISTDEGFGMIVYFDKLMLPSGSSIMAYSDNKKQKVGPFYENNNTMTNAFALPLINNNSLIVEAKIPLSKYADFEMDISEIGCVVMSGNDEKHTKGFGDTESCYVNVNCTEGEPWAKQKRAVVRYTYTQDGEIGNCSGSLINNTALDDKNFFLTAQHCAMGASADELGQAIFYFNYESPDCDNPPNDDGLLDETVVGCTRIAASGDGNDPGGAPDGSDFHLFELNPIPDSYNIYYAGWNRNDVDNLSGPGSIIQHPLSDIKKISFVSEFIQALTGSDLEAVTTTTAGGQGGNVEANASGSAMFDNMKLVVGTISYGSTGCVTSGFNSGAGGKFFYHWDQNGTENNRKLSPWLDPSNTGVMTLEGKDGGNVGLVTPLANKINVKISPNPFVNQIQLEFNEAITTSITATVYDMHGQLIYSKIIHDQTSNINELRNAASGIYYLHLSGENGQINTYKLIKL